ncbi:serpin peptidase inhibitor, clade E (nexin, plasminogen activator inhibitor type 1), member 2 S homeolog isoform X1 [Xenopus laevis]|uniref:Serpin peptidase inhibitor, clade E (Nexin, plasminogen activator inhibitor type 1), member 2 S homeolog isoform X1 n=2 Tax=Xenopus laevis TaxID=8355 RepID=A0A1L8G4N8_XENLA|nr:serpin peptidase inhibitor, clade E (nexin, plasminogen activator inhibitor type 1), member 2 S homeolog isoform X1 [Xenopus laevis]XP_018119968.1 serpin peptidase inhibitor, clade E (nexin, plasminogen activator inhibitor type 1), member 2 S homeolog isoform X1 [Xenopus laevis]XP_018119970.1 serpin peptidase inhibitor, clade E (nexin, plasminogen activator inhibitor type 1), member 2 S homeolog isoform X1 [Xenopus laevis]XP_018119971.1 serpin peptidase inhibitor, clade E (nexin, plasminogen 
MRRLVIFPFLVAFLASVQPELDPLSLEELGSDIGIQVFNQVARTRPHENIVMSPHGISSVLGMLQLGADGRTKKQLMTVMQYKINEVAKNLKKTNRAIVAKKNKDIVTTANGVFASSAFKMEGSFVYKNKDIFHSDVRSVDFQEKNTAASIINQWVKNQTKGMIEGLISPELLDSSVTRLVLVNALYFKGLWKSRFHPENTKKRTFHGLDGKDRQVPMLAQLSLFRSGSASTPNGLWYNVIELPYHGGSISMLVALPTEKSTPLSAIIPHISTKTLQSWMTMSPKRVQLILPKFSVEAEADLKEPLRNLGITEMFDVSKANFAKISRSESLHVSHLLQKAKIEVNEEGTKASGATTAVLIARSSPRWFTVDRPFLFFIRHNPTGAVLFTGQINKP